MVSRLKSDALQLYTNLRGWKTDRKLLIFESDDWGATRMPSHEAYQDLLRAGIRLDRSPYNRLDCLESRDDFQALMNVLSSHQDASGRPATFTFNTVMGNPDFGAIEADGYREFHHQHMFDSYRYFYGEDLEADWQNAITAGYIRPQFHAREHLNCNLWLKDLRNGHPETRIAFKHKFYGLETKTSSAWQEHYGAAYSAESAEQLNAMKAIVREGICQFEATFGFTSRTSVACNYVLPAEIEGYLAKAGVEMIQTQRGYMQPLPLQDGRRRKVSRFTGQRNEYGQFYSVRNVLFEPYLDISRDWVKSTLSEIDRAFRLGKPAIVCSHRINYVSSMCHTVRDRTLSQLDEILHEIRRRWPEAEFYSSDDLWFLLRNER